MEDQIARLFGAAATRVPLAVGWDCEAWAVAGCVVKRPKTAAAEARLRREAGLLALVRPRVRMALPDLHLIEGPPLLSWHVMLQGGHLLPGDYAGLSGPARDRLAGDLAGLMGDLHRVVAASEVEPWVLGEAALARAVAVLPAPLAGVAVEVAAQFAGMPADALVYGQFDGHGWNMAFDHERGVLNGVYDFADSGIGPQHRDFIYAGLVSFDLMERVVRRYVGRGHAVDLRRVVLLAGVHRLWELSNAGEERAEYVARFADWAATYPMR